jgi:arsenite methyltransferase
LSGDHTLDSGRQQQPSDARSAWVFNRRFGGDGSALKQTNTWLEPIVARVLDGAAIHPGDSVLDVGSRDGYVALRALTRCGPSGRVTMTEMSDKLLDRLHALAEREGITQQTRFARFPPTPLAAPDASFDAITVRSIFSYVDNPVDLLRELRRVLIPGRSLSLIQMFGETESALDGDYFMGYNVADLPDVISWMEEHHPQVLRQDGIPVYSADDVIAWVEDAGFTTFEAAHELSASPTSNWPPRDWEVTIDMAGAPGAPTIREVMDDCLPPAMAARLEACLRPQVETGRRRARFRRLYVCAVR